MRFLSLLSIAPQPKVTAVRLLCLARRQAYFRACMIRGIRLEIALKGRYETSKAYITGRFAEHQLPPNSVDAPQPKLRGTRKLNTF